MTEREPPVRKTAAYAGYKVDLGDYSLWSVPEAVRILGQGTGLNVHHLRLLVRAAGLKPQGFRHSSSMLGRPSAVYPATELIALVDDWMEQTLEG